MREGNCFCTPPIGIPRGALETPPGTVAWLCGGGSDGQRREVTIPVSKRRDFLTLSLVLCPMPRSVLAGRCRFLHVQQPHVTSGYQARLYRCLHPPGKFYRTKGTSS